MKLSVTITAHSLHTYSYALYRAETFYYEVETMSKCNICSNRAMTIEKCTRGMRLSVSFVMK